MMTMQTVRPGRFMWRARTRQLTRKRYLPQSARVSVQKFANTDQQQWISRAHSPRKYRKRIFHLTSRTKKKFFALSGIDSKKGGVMSTRKGAPTKAELRRQQIEKEKREVLELNPLTMAERLRAQLSNEIDRSLQRLSNAIGDKQLDERLLAAMAAHRRYTAFSHELSQITGKNIYEVRSGSIQHRLGSQELQRRAKALRGSSQPPAPLSDECKTILEAVRAAQPKPAGLPKLVEGENEWRDYLEKNNLTESDPNADYESRSRASRSNWAQRSGNVFRKFPI